MSNHEPRLPPEIFDSIIDILHDEPETLKNCILVSKSWVPRSRQYLFSDVTFRSPLDIEGWKKTFRDPASSPACHAHSLSVRYTGWVTDADTKEGGWIHTFANVARLELWSTMKVWLHLGEPLEPYHNFPSINLRSLRVVSHTLWPIQISNLVHTLPFLEDLAIINNGKVDFSYRNGTAPPESLPSTSPPLTGTLYIHRLQKYILRRLVELPNGLHFRGFTCSGCTYEDLEWVTTLVEKCSGTIECVDVDCQIIENASIDLSKARKLKQVAFRFDINYLAWITAALGTITPQHKYLRQIVLHIPSPSPLDDDEPIKIGETLTEEACSQWRDLDRLLVRLYELQEVHTKVECTGKEQEEVWKSLGVLLPEMAKRT